MRLIQRNLNLLEQTSLIQKWKPLLDYASDTLVRVRDSDRAKYADILEQVEARYIKYDDILRVLIPLARRHGDLVYFEEGIYTPTPSQPYYGKSFRAVKIINPEQSSSRFLAFSLEPEYKSSEPDIHSTGFMGPSYYFTFDF